MAQEQTYETIDRPYDSLLQRSSDDVVPGDGQTEGVRTVTDGGQAQGTGGSNGNVETQPVKSEGGIADIWIKNFIRSENWKPKTLGFYIDGQTGYAEFSNVYVSGDIQALTGTIGGFTIGATELTATSGGNTTILSSGPVAFSAGPTGAPTVTITQSGILTAVGGGVGGFDIGEDYIRDSANSFGLASTVTAGDDIRFWAGDTFANRATAPARITEGGSAFFKNIQIGGSNIQYQVGDGGIFSFGDGSDGDVVISGDTTMTADRYYENLTIDAGKTLYPNGWRIFVRGVLTLNGSINGDGPDGGDGTNGGYHGAGGTGGTGGTTAAGYFLGSSAGSGGSSVVDDPGYPGENGEDATNSLVLFDGASGGDGGEGSPTSPDMLGGTGGVGGTTTQSNVKLIANWHLATLLDISSTGATLKFTVSGSAGGGGSGGSAYGGGGNQKGGGGGGGGANGRIIAIYARSIVISATGTISSNGGNGGDGGGTNSGDGLGGGGGGGGGGGNGGVVILAYNQLSNLGTVTVTGGTGGAGGVLGGAPIVDETDGLPGEDGNDGVIYWFNLSL